jgi:hypothetical protein
MTARYSAVLVILLIASCSKKIHDYPYEVTAIPLQPDYSSLDSWAAHPDKEDASDLLPGKGQFTKDNPLPEVDVFFIHPTTYTKKQNPDWPWQGNMYNNKLNSKTDHSTIQYQASVFNGSTQVYAPRYRQAHINVFRMPASETREKALQLAYYDVKSAFEYYLSNYNKGKAFILASHSQGSLHAARLMKELIDGQPLQQRMIAAYLVGYAIEKDSFSQVKPCNQPDDINCWISWNTFERNYYPANHQSLFLPSLSTNPLTWSTDTLYAPAALNQGAVLRNFRKIYINLCDAQNHEGLLWITKPKFFGSALYRSKRYHIADYNLFYTNIRSNVKLRIQKYLELRKNTASSIQSIRN